MNVGDLVQWRDFRGASRLSLIVEECLELERNSAGTAYLARNSDGTTAVIRDSYTEVISERR